MSFAASFVVLKEHHTARQTRILQRMPRMKSGTKAALFYWVTCLLIEFVMRRIEKKMDYYHD